MIRCGCFLFLLPSVVAQGWWKEYTKGERASTEKSILVCKMNTILYNTCKLCHETMGSQIFFCDVGLGEIDFEVSFKLWYGLIMVNYGWIVSNIGKQIPHRKVDMWEDSFHHSDIFNNNCPCLGICTQLELLLSWRFKCNSHQTGLMVCHNVRSTLMLVDLPTRINITQLLI